LLSRESHSKADSAIPAPEGLLIAFKGPKEKILFTTEVDRHINDRQHGWSVKTEMENECSCRLILDIPGDVDVCGIVRLLVRDLRNKLVLFPADI